MPATAADLPPELFPLILDYLCTDVRGDDEDDRDVWVQDMMSCSLVCLYWANRCREYLFRGHEVVIKSLAEFLTLESYAADGCTRLVPLYDVIRRFTVEQTWDSAAWCYRIYKSRLRALRWSELVLRGPVPSHLPRAAYRSPHWSLPRSMPSCYLPLFNFTLHDIHFPCLSDLLALLRHFKHSEGFITLESVTWAEVDIHGPVRSFGRRQEMRGRDWPTVIAGGCTDNTVVCILATGALETCPMSHLRETELANISALVRVITGMGSDDIRVGEYESFAVAPHGECTLMDAYWSSVAYHPTIPDRSDTDLIDDVPGVTWDPSLSVQLEASFADDLSIKLKVQCSAVRTHNGRLASLRIVGLNLEVETFDTLGLTDQDVQLLALVIRGFHTLLPAFPHLRVVALCFQDLSTLKATVKFAPDVSQLPELGAQQVYRWGCFPHSFDSESVRSMSDTYEYVGVDPATLEPTGT